AVDTAAQVESREHAQDQDRGHRQADQELDKGEAGLVLSWCLHREHGSPHLVLSIRTVKCCGAPSEREPLSRACQTSTSISLMWTWPRSAVPGSGLFRMPSNMKSLTLYCRTRVRRCQSAGSALLAVPVTQVWVALE